jgi:hypothetical protein
MPPVCLTPCLALGAEDIRDLQGLSGHDLTYVVNDRLSPFLARAPLGTLRDPNPQCSKDVQVPRSAWMRRSGALGSGLPADLS